MKLHLLSSAASIASHVKLDTTGASARFLNSTSERALQSLLRWFLFPLLPHGHQGTGQWAARPGSSGGRLSTEPCRARGSGCTAPGALGMPQQTRTAPRDPGLDNRAELIPGAEWSRFNSRPSALIKSLGICARRWASTSTGMNGKRCLHTSQNQNPSAREAL